MIKFFRKIRQNLLSEGKTGKYLKYAIGEILLVVIGILIALQVNNQNNIHTEKRELQNYLEKIASNVKNDIIVSQNMLTARTEQSALCANATELISKRNFSSNSQAIITEAMFTMMVEQPLNYNRSGFESLKNSGYLRYLDNSKVERLIYNYYNATDKILSEENSFQVWSNDLDLQLQKNGFISQWLELDARPNQKITDAVGNYKDELCKHPGHNIVLSLFYRGFLFTAYLTDFYKEQISAGKELLNALQEYDE